MGSGLLLLGLLILLSIETVQAWRVRSRYCTICGRKMGVWHVEACHKKGHYSPGVAITIILGLYVAVALTVYLLSTG
jgi:hypothetical protein